MRTTNVIAVLLVVLLGLFPSLSNGGGWTAVPGNSNQRILNGAETEITIWDSDDAPTTSTTGVLLNYTCTGSEAAGDQISAASITPTTGSRTVAINFTDDDATVSTPVFTVEGYLPGNIRATERFEFDETDHSTDTRTLYGDLPFLTVPEIKVYITELGAIESGDLLDINPWGFFVKGCPSRYQDIGSMVFYDASGTSSAVIATDSTYFTNYFSTKGFSWNPPPLNTGGVTALAEGDKMIWYVSSSNTSPSDPWTALVSGSVVTNTVAESD